MLDEKELQRQMQAVRERSCVTTCAGMTRMMIRELEPLGGKYTAVALKLLEAFDLLKKIEYGEKQN